MTIVFTRKTFTHRGNHSARVADGMVCTVKTHSSLRIVCATMDQDVGVGIERLHGNMADLTDL